MRTGPDRARSFPALPYTAGFRCMTTASGRAAARSGAIRCDRRRHVAARSATYNGVPETASASLQTSRRKSNPCCSRGLTTGKMARRRSRAGCTGCSGGCAGSRRPHDGRRAWPCRAARSPAGSDSGSRRTPGPAGSSRSPGSARHCPARSSAASANRALVAVAPGSGQGRRRSSGRSCTPAAPACSRRPRRSPQRPVRRGGRSARAGRRTPTAAPCARRR